MARGDFLDDLFDGDGDDDAIAGLVEVGALTEVGAQAVSALMQGRITPQDLKAKLAKIPKQRPTGGRLPSPPFARSERSTERRAPLGFTEESTGAKFFTLAAGIGSTTTMRAKVSREAHVDRLLIVPNSPGAVIQSIFVGDEEQVLAAGAPVELYGEPALTDTLPDNFSPIGPALDFIVVLVNTTALAITGTIGLKAAVKR